MVRPITTSRSSQEVPLCIETCSKSPSIVAGPSSFASSVRGNSSIINGSERRALVFALNERLQTTSGDETRKLLPAGSSENTGDEPAAWRLSASSTTFDRLSLSMTTSDAAGFLRKLRATSPSGASSASCAVRHEGRAKRKHC